MEDDQMFSGRGRCSEYLWQEAFRMAVYLANRVPCTSLGGKTPFLMWYGGTPPRLEHLRTFGARAFVHEERYIKNLTMYAWEGRMLGYGKALTRTGFGSLETDRLVPKCNIDRDSSC